MEKQTFELKDGVTRVQITRQDGSTLQIEEGDVRETGDPFEVAELQAHPSVKAAEPKKAAK